MDFPMFLYIVSSVKALPMHAMDVGTGDTCRPPPPPPPFFQRTKIALFCDEKYPFCTS
jgi:hypothetical protein